MENNVIDSTLNSSRESEIVQNSIVVAKGRIADSDTYPTGLCKFLEETRELKEINFPRPYGIAVLTKVIQTAAELVQKNNLRDISDFPNLDQLTESVIEWLLSEKPFSGLRILCIGGIEGRVLALMGAEVVNVDPQITTENISLPNLIEIAERFNPNQPFLKSGFDIIFSSRLFDRGSGLVDYIDNSCWIKKMREIFSITREGGFSIHDGREMHRITPHLGVPAEVYLVFRTDTSEQSSPVWRLSL